MVLPFKRPSWSMWIDQVKRRRKNGNKTERSRKSLIRERYDEVCIYRGSAKNQKETSAFLMELIASLYQMEPV